MNAEEVADLLQYQEAQMMYLARIAEALERIAHALEGTA